MRTMESHPQYRAKLLFQAANGAALDSITHRRAGRPHMARQSRLDALGMRELARNLIRGTQ